MFLNDLLIKMNMSRYRLAKESGISKTFHVSIESLIEEVLVNDDNQTPQRLSFDVFKSHTCHLVKDKGDIQFLIDVLEKDEIREFYNKNWYPEAFYLLAMVDYLSRKNNIPLCTAYSDLRCQKLSEPIYPSGMLIYDEVMKKNTKQECIQNAIPEFLKFNIIESEIRNVY